MLVLVVVLAPHAIGPLAIILGPAVLLLIGGTWWSLRGETAREGQAVALGNPLELGAALALAAFVAVSAIASHWALAAYGDAGVAGVLAIIGLADVDAAVIAFAAMAPGAITPRMAGVVLAMPVLLNMVLKTGPRARRIAIACGISPRRHRSPSLAVAIALGIAVALA